MDSLKHIVEDVLKDIKEKEASVKDRNALPILEKILNKKQIKHIRVHSFKKGVLKIEADSTSMIFYLNLKKKTIIKELIKQTGIQKDKIKIYFNLINKA